MALYESKNCFLENTFAVLSKLFSINHLNNNLFHTLKSILIRKTEIITKYFCWLPELEKLLNLQSMFEPPSSDQVEFSFIRY